MNKVIWLFLMLFLCACEGKTEVPFEAEEIKYPEGIRCIKIVAYGKLQVQCTPI